MNYTYVTFKCPRCQSPWVKPTSYLRVKYTWICRDCNEQFDLTEKQREEIL